MITVALIVVWWLSGMGLALLWWGRRALAPVEVVALGGGFGLVLVIASAWLSIQARPATVAFVVMGLFAIPWLLYRLHTRPSPAPVTSTAVAGVGQSLLRSALPAIAITLLAAFFRFTDLGYSEFQGDEARAMQMAYQLVDSHDPEVLYLHKKGPVEVLLPTTALHWGDFRERSARLPFAVAGLCAVLALFALGRRMWTERAGLVAGLLLALDGYLIAFGRIVQYQSVVVLFSALAVWCAWRFYRDEKPIGGTLVLAGVFLGAGSWAHYEMVFALPPVAWLVVARARAEGWPARLWLRRLLPPILVMTAVTAAFYLPFVIHPHFAETIGYITGRRIGGGVLYNQLADYFNRASFYNASTYVLFMSAVLVAVVAWQLARSSARWGRTLAAVWLGALAIVLLAPAAVTLGERSLAILAFLPVLLALLASPRIDSEWKALMLWFAGPFLVAAFLTEKPHTHFYTMMPAWALLVGRGLDQALAWLERRGGVRALRLAGALGVALFGVFALHQYVVFVRHTPEYKRVYPEARLPGYWVPFGDEPPRGGYFGFPYRAGWNIVGELFDNGALAGDYDSNEEGLITGWYTRGAPRCVDEPRYYIVAWRPQDAEEIPMDEIHERYHLRTTVVVNGQEKLWIYDREPSVGVPATIQDEPGHTRQLGIAGPTRNGPMPVSQALELPLPQIARDDRFGHRLRLTGLDFPALAALHWRQLHEASSEPNLLVPPGAVLPLMLHWQAYAPLDVDYEVAVSVVNAAGQEVAAESGRPECGQAATSTWQVGAFHYDAHAIELPADLPDGIYELRAGLYDPATGEPLPLHSAGEPAADEVVLARFEVRPTG